MCVAKRQTTRSGGGRSAKAAKRPPGAGDRIVVLAGKEMYLRSAWLEDIREKLGAAHGNVEVIRFAGTASPAEVLDECRSPSLMVPHKLVVVDEADQFVKGDDRRAIVERYAETPSEDATLVLRAEVWHSGKLDKLIEKVGTIVECNEVTLPEAIKWATRRVSKRHGREIEPEAAELLVERVGVDLARLDGELAKLSSATAEGETISASTVADLVGLTREQTVWLIQNVALEGDVERSLRFVRELVEVSRVPPLLIRFAIVDLLKKLHGMAAWMHGGRSGARPNIWPRDVAESIARAAGRVERGALLGLYERAMEADYEAKRGHGDELRGVEMLLVRFSGLFGGAADSREW